MDAGNAVTPLCFPNFHSEVLALVDASVVDFRTDRPCSGFVSLGEVSFLCCAHCVLPLLAIELILNPVQMCLRDFSKQKISEQTQKASLKHS